MSLLPIISREEAWQKGLKRFFTGKPCKHGHVCERRVDSSECAECGRTRGRAYHRRPDVKERVQAHRQQPDVKERIQERVRAWAQRPEVRERRRAYHRRPEVKERKRRPEVRAQQRAYQQRPDVKERRQRPEVKERRLAYLRIWRQRPDVKERIRAYSQRRGLAYRQRPEVKEHKKEYQRAYRQRPEVKERERAPAPAAGCERTEPGLPPGAGGEEAIAGMGAETPRYESSEQRQQRVTQEVGQVMRNLEKFVRWKSMMPNCGQASV